ncbi:hypothetical protein SAMN05660657_03652 [Geodermatophilus amargosae]|uniref:EamA-like transporter family protein n=2 Tax=Geodermatophilus amargosae TaxID=1296565 RepID=A0A1I7BJV5_9ACTN|nr:hypothetical protein SAMN05660657_03652 [Geodermatophilus amargosae]
MWLGVAGGTMGTATACRYAALAQDGASRMAAPPALQMLVALALDACLLDEPVGAVHLAGILGILPAVTLAGRAREHPDAVRRLGRGSEAQPPRPHRSAPTGLP